MSGRKGVKRPEGWVNPRKGKPNGKAVPWAQRFWQKVDKNTPTGCWQWTACLNMGYGWLWADGKSQRVHRLIYQLLYGMVVPDALDIDHMCRNRGCCNPDHLRIVTPRVNSIQNNESLPAFNLSKTECSRGHPYTPENTARPPKGGRICLTCFPYYWRHAEIPRATAARSPQGEARQPSGPGRETGMPVITLTRYAELSASIARRLYLWRNWTGGDRAKHAAEVREREAILCAASPDYAAVLAEARERGLLDEPAPVAAGCATESECDWQPWCRINGKCKREPVAEGGLIGEHHDTATQGTRRQFEEPNAEGAEEVAPPAQAGIQQAARHQQAEQAEGGAEEKRPETSDRMNGIRAAWDAIDKIIPRGEISEPWRHEQRNGMVLACNAVAHLMGWPLAKYAEEIEQSSQYSSEPKL